MFSQYHKKAIEKKGSCYFFENVFYSAENKEFVSTNGHVLLIEKTDKDFKQDMMFNPVTCQPCEDQEEAGVKAFPDNYRSVIPKNPEVRFEYYKIFKRKYRSRNWAKDIISFRFGKKEIIFNKQYIDTAILFVSEVGSYKVYADNEEKAVVFESNGRKAAVMPMKIHISDFNYLEISSGVEYLPKGKKIKTEKIFVVIDKNGNVKCAYSNESDANLANESGYVKEALLIK